jgi:AraC-like DNA-binding protein
MTSMQRAEWLESIRDDKKTVKDTAADLGISPGTLNYHCQRLYGVTYAEWIQGTEMSA